MELERRTICLPERERRSMSVIETLLLTTAIAGVGGTGLGGLIGAMLQKDSNRVVSLLLSFAGGVMLSVVCFDLAVEAIETGVGIFSVIAAIALGVTGALLLGTGMSLAMTEMSGLADAAAMLLGIPIGLAGIVLVALAYPVYQRVLKKERQRIAPEILRLSDELLQ